MRWITATIYGVGKNYDWVLTIVVFILIAIGLVSIYSVDLSRGDELVFFPTQVVSVIIGILVYFVAGYAHITMFQYLAKPIYLASLIMLVAVLFFGITVRGTTGWFRFAGLSLQPVEFAKVALIILLAWWIQRHKRRFDKWQFVITTGFFTFIYSALIILQPDLGSAVVLSGIWFFLLLMTGTKRRYLIALVTVLVVVIFFSWQFLFQDYQKDRFRTFLDPQSDPLGSGYNVTQSIIAIGSGRFFGRGLGFGSQSQLHFLPEAQTDFIFSVVAEELGFVGTFIILALFCILLWRLIRIAGNANTDFGSYCVLGVAVVFLIQILFNVGGSTGLLPVTGVTLPFISYGGSSVIASFLLLGIVQSIHKSQSQSGY